MKSGSKNLIVAVCILFASNVQAQKSDSINRNSVNDLIELENSKNLIPTTKNNPPVYIQKSEPKTLVRKKKTVLKFGKKNKSYSI